MQLITSVPTNPIKLPKFKLMKPDLASRCVISGDVLNQVADGSATIEYYFGKASRVKTMNFSQATWLFEGYDPVLVRELRFTSDSFYEISRDTRAPEVIIVKLSKYRPSEKMTALRKLIEMMIAGDEELELQLQPPRPFRSEDLLEDISALETELRYHSEELRRRNGPGSTLLVAGLVDIDTFAFVDRATTARMIGVSIRTELNDDNPTKFVYLIDSQDLNRKVELTINMLTGETTATAGYRGPLNAVIYQMISDRSINLIETSSFHHYRPSDIKSSLERTFKRCDENGSSESDELSSDEDN